MQNFKNRYKLKKTFQPTFLKHKSQRLILLKNNMINIIVKLNMKITNLEQSY